MQLWNVYVEAQTWRQRPSTMMGITDEYVAYCFDEAASEWGNHVRGKLDAVEGPNSKVIQARQETLLRQLLRGEGLKNFYSAPVATTTKEELAEQGIEV